MPLRVGIDLVEVAAVEASLRAHPNRYLQRVYTEREVADCRTAQGVDPERLAARFAAKEATLKVLRPATTEAIPWPTIEVRRHAAGWVDLELGGAAAELAAQAGLEDFAVSLSHERGFAAAVVIATYPQGAPRPDRSRQR